MARRRAGCARLCLPLSWEPHKLTRVRRARARAAVMRAIGTHPGHVEVTLDIQKCVTLKQLAAEG